MYLPISISIILQVLCAVHAVKTGRHRWLWIILIFSFVGCLVYVIAEVLPDFKPMADKVVSGAQGVITPNHKIIKMKSELELCDTVKNRVELANAYIEQKQFSEAISVLEHCRSGAYSNDLEVLTPLAHSYFAKGEYQKTKDILSPIKETPVKFENQNAHLLYAVSVQKLGEKEEALKRYEDLLSKYIGEEARCRYALYLKQLGRMDEAKKVFEQIVNKCRVSPPFYRKEHKVWLQTAENELKTEKK